MKTLFLTLVILLYSKFLPGQEKVFWTQHNNTAFTSPNRVASFGFVIGDKAYLICGTTDFYVNFTNEVWEYDINADTWTPKNDFPGASRLISATFTIGNYGYVAGGAPTDVSPAINEAWKYDPSTDTWTSIADLPIAMANTTGFSINNKGYVCTGRDGMSLWYDNLYEYDPVTDTWSAKASIPAVGPFSGRANATGFTFNDKGYIIGGRFSLPIMTNEFWEYDPSLNIWTQLANFVSYDISNARHEMPCFVINDSIYCGFGDDNYSQTFGTLSRYDRVSDSWIDVDSFCYGPSPREAMFNFVYNNKGYMVNGFDEAHWPSPEYYQEVWSFMPEKNSIPGSIGGSADTLCLGDTILLSAPSFDGISYLWSTGGTDTSIVVAPENNSIYSVQLSQNSCYDTINYNLYVVECNETVECEQMIPNVFTPNNNVLNEKFVIPCFIDGEELRIYNRWGQLLFTTFKKDEMWDGNYRDKECSVGVYYYIYKRKANENKAGFLHLFR